MGAKRWEALMRYLLMWKGAATGRRRPEIHEDIIEMAVPAKISTRSATAIGRVVGAASLGDQ
jgi:hypothetical protein